MVSILGFQVPTWDVKLNVIFALLYGLPYLVVQFGHIENAYIGYVFMAGWVGFGLKNMVVSGMFVRHLVRKAFKK